MLFRKNIEVKLSNENVKSFDLRKKHQLSLKEIEYLLDRFENLKPIAKIIYDCQNKYNINTYFIIGLIRNESFNGRSRLAVENNNLIGARTNSKWMSFKTKEECIIFLYDLLSNNYLSKEGKYNNGYTIDGVNKKYCGTINWSNTISSIMVQSYNQIAAL